MEEKITNRIDDLLEKSNAVIDTYKTYPDWGAFIEWKTQTQSFLINLLGSQHNYVESFQKEFTDITPSKIPHIITGGIAGGQAILRAVREDVLGGYLTDVRTLISAEVFTDFLEMVEHLLDNGYKDAAATLCGAVLEDGLRRIASKNGVTVRSKEDLNSLTQKCADKGIFNRLVQKKINVWNEIRNNAAHGKFDEYSEQDVRDMEKGVNQFLAVSLK
jgi:hypothetical protein